MSRFAVNHYICPEATPFGDFLELARAVGAGAVGLTVRAVDEIGVARLKTMLDDTGLAVSSLNSAGYFTWADPDRAADQHRRNRDLIEAAAALGAGVLCVITGGKGDGSMALETARARIAEGLAGLADLAQGYNVRLGVEPIHPADIMRKGCVNSIADALALTSDLPNVGVILDLYHSWWDPGLRTAFERHLSRVALVQICNVYDPGPGLPPDRETLASGEIDVAGLLRFAEARGYAGWYEFELFAHHLRGRLVEDVLRNAAASFESGLDPTNTRLLRR